MPVSSMAVKIGRKLRRRLLLGDNSTRPNSANAYNSTALICSNDRGIGKQRTVGNHFLTTLTVTCPEKEISPDALAPVPRSATIEYTLKTATAKLAAIDLWPKFC